MRGMFLPCILNCSLSGAGRKWFTISWCVNTCLWVTAGAGQPCQHSWCRERHWMAQPGPHSFPHTGGPEQGRELFMGPNFYISSKISQADFHSLLFPLYQLYQLYQFYQIQDRSKFQGDFMVRSCNEGYSAVSLQLQSMRASCAKVPLPLPAEGTLESEGRAEPPPALFPWAAPGTDTFGRPWPCGHTLIVPLCPSADLPHT